MMFVDPRIIVQFIKKNPTSCNNVSNFYYSIFIWSSTCFGRHTAHHQEPKTALAASGFSYVEGCWTCSWWTLSGTLCQTTSTNYTTISHTVIYVCSCFFSLQNFREISEYFIKKNPTRCNNVSKFYYSIFIWGSTCFGRHTAHHQEPKTALAASGFSYVEGYWTCSWWTLSGTLCQTTSTNYTYVYVNNTSKSNYYNTEAHFYVSRLQFRTLCDSISIPPFTVCVCVTLAG